ncbi:hypothetical protein FOMPIDRAFT_82302 [Fomitopsis schrenkii]|uniref:BTB domain-containing protein n=1 Tax=Fomitopsis schrenkii TaxID=2126942 RepID=S8DSR3_FOMSC|nr:hypothetical protein FOMPIDRAFT_82302 [Fomitopsis schrenkii]
MAPKSARKGDRKANHPSPIPRTLTKDELFLATLRSGITDGNLFNTKLYTYSRRTPSAVDKPRPVYANEAALKHASDYFVSLFDWDFQEGRMSTEDYDYMSDSDLEDADEPASDLSDSCKERDTAKATKNQVDGTDDTSASVTPASEETVAVDRNEKSDRPKILETVAYKTLQSFVFWSLTGKISFAPLRSQSSAIHLQTESKMLKLYEPPPCSPKSMYRFAHMCEVEELKLLALEDLTSKLNHDNVLTELFSSFTTRYSEVQEAEVHALVHRLGLTQTVLGTLPMWTTKVASGELGPQSGDIVAKLVQKLAR